MTTRAAFGAQEKNNRMPQRPERKKLARTQSPVVATTRMDGSSMGLFQRLLGNKNQGSSFSVASSGADLILKDAGVGATIYVGRIPTVNRPVERIGVETTSLEPFMLIVRNGRWLVGDAMPDDALMSDTGIPYVADSKVIALVVGSTLRSAWLAELENGELPHLGIMHGEMMILDPTFKLFQKLAQDTDVFVSQMAQALVEDAQSAED